nr:MAG TPA: hypothetical protein [Caudoviricetes sp.]
MQLTDQICILSALGSREILLTKLTRKVCDLGILVLHTHGDKLIMQLTIVGICIVRDVTRRIRNGIGDSTGVGSHSILNVCLALTVLTAAICKLRTQTVNRGLGIVVTLHGSHLLAVETLKQRRVHGVETVAHTAVDTIELVQDALGIKTGLKVGRSCRRSSSTITAITIAVATPSEQGEEDDPGPPAISITPSAIAVTIRNGSDIGQARCTIAKHNVPPYFAHRQKNIINSDSI